MKPSKLRKLARIKSQAKAVQRNEVARITQAQHAVADKYNYYSMHMQIRHARYY